MAPARAHAPQPTDLPDPSDLELPPRPTGALMFQTPSPSPDPSEEKYLVDPEDASPSGDDPSESWPEANDEPPRSSKASSTEIASLAVTIVEAARLVVLGLGAFAHQRLARDEAAKTVEMWATDEDDAESIGDPLGHMANRRLGRMAGATSPDAGDIFEAVAGILAYGMKQGAKWRQARQLRRNAARIAPAQGDADSRSDAPVGEDLGAAVPAPYGA